VNCEFRGRPLACMLDTGCDRSVIGRRYIKSRDLEPVRFSLMGAGRNSLKVDGETFIQFSIDGHPMEADVSVSSSMDELLLGCDFLTKHKGRWDFATGIVQLGDIEVQTRPKRAPGIACWRLVVAEKFTVPARHDANIPVRMESDGKPQPTVEWAVESRAMKSGVRVARTLFGDESMVRVARILNQMNSSFKLEEGDYFTTAEPVITYRGPAARSSIPSDQTEREWEWRPGRIQRHLTSASVRRGEAAPAGAEATASDCSHVQCLIDGLPDHPTAEQRVMAERFIRTRANIFSRSEFDIGRTDILKHRIDTGNNPPHYERLHHHPTTQLPVIDAHVEEMLKHDVIEPAASPWCSNVVMVRKKDGYAVLYRLPEN